MNNILYKVTLCLILSLAIILMISCSESTSQESSNNTNNSLQLNGSDDNQNGEKQDGENQDDDDEVQIIQEGKKLVEERCTQCHDLDKVEEVSYDKDTWIETVDTMISYGANLNDKEKEKVIEYLYYSYGEDLVEQRCTQCHKLSKIDEVSYDQEGWTSVVDTMIGYGANLNDKEKDAVINYLVLKSIKE